MPQLFECCVCVYVCVVYMYVVCVRVCVYVCMYVCMYVICNIRDCGVVESVEIC